MNMNPYSEKIIEKTESNLKVHTFTVMIAEKVVKFEVLKFKDSIFLWIGDKHNRTFQDLSLALISQCASEPVCTKIMGLSTDLTSNNLGLKLSKRLGKPVYVSFNLVDDRLTVPMVNKILAEEIHRNPQFF